MEAYKILVVDDESIIRHSLKRILEPLEYRVSLCVSAEEALNFLNEQSFDVIFCDIKLPHMDGLSLIKAINNKPKRPLVVAMTGYGSIDGAVKAMQAGAFHYITKPFELNDIKNLIAQIDDKLNNQTIYMDPEDRLIGDSDAIKEVFHLIKKVSNSSSTILITGESGTGKELVAKAIHSNSSRKNKPLVPVNCAAIPSELLESELFGHVKGAFTGAIANRIGRFELANHGSLFLDEIGDMTKNLQVKILRVLQEKTFESIGAQKTTKVDVRIIAATNRNLEKLIKEDLFREDLFYRLNVIPIHIPPLRDRKSDIESLCHHFIRKYNSEQKRQVESIDASTMNVLKSYPWPGNIRELENLIQRLVILTEDGIVMPCDLPDKYHIHTRDGYSSSKRTILSDEGISFNDVVNDFENDLILQALQRTNWNKNKAATLLSINRTTLVEKIKKKKLQMSKA